ncbi:hypothetical protein MACJ_002756 [Theileria orientalis]|uniref:Hemolysin III n=1 Tax=Theileria orientalis TaxID=68886 RepID=A0A976M6Q2_THEOR|nr:hypothetical protein MACJ_002756 [Theileria orientalis]
MLSKIAHNIRDHKRDVPLLRGRIHLLSLLFYPFVIRSLKKNVPKELKYSLVIFIVSHLFNLITTTLLHNNQLYEYRSAYKRIDIASVFVVAPGLSFPVAVYFMKNDWFMAAIVYLQWILSFVGVFGSLVFDFCSFQKEYRSMYVAFMNLPDVLIIYKLFAKGEYLSSLLSTFGLIFFFVGGIVYCQEGPPIIDGLIGHHEIFHLLTVIGFGLVVGANRSVVK